MYKAKLNKDITTYLECGIDLFVGKWESRVIVLLGSCDFMRFSVMRQELVTVSDGVLSATLKQLQKDGIVSWRKSITAPPAKEYYLTEKGKAILPIFDQITEWADTWHREECKNLLKKRKESYGR